MRKKLRDLVSATLMILALGAPLRGALVLPLEAIEASAVLSATEFRETYPGVMATPESLGATGFFVVYEHENLQYFFGPAGSFGEARVWEDRLLDVRADVVDQRPALASSRVYIFRFDFEGSRRWSERHPVEPADVGREDAAPAMADERTGMVGRPGSPTEEPSPRSFRREELPAANDPPPATREDDAASQNRAPQPEERGFWRFVRRVFGFS